MHKKREEIYRRYSLAFFPRNHQNSKRKKSFLSQTKRYEHGKAIHKMNEVSKISFHKSFFLLEHLNVEVNIIKCHEMLKKTFYNLNLVINDKIKFNDEVS